MKRDLLSLADLQPQELQEVIELAEKLKRDLRGGAAEPVLRGKSMAMIFEKPSLRTRVTFEVGMTQLGGYPIYLTPSDIQLGQRESVPDIARNLERWVDLIMARTFAHATLEALARHAQVPVINALSDRFHPCQVLADCLTLVEKRGKLDGLRVAFIGDANNMAHSWINAAARVPIDFVLACPAGYEPQAQVLQEARDAGARVQVTQDVAEAARDADAVYTDAWTSMGQEEEEEQRRRDFAGYQVNGSLLRQARPDVVVMHCLPAHRGEEITDEVIDGPNSVVFEQAENRLHAQKAVMVWLIEQAARRTR
jgi:ornithine carbamoyltransferase